MHKGGDSKDWSKFLVSNKVITLILLLTTRAENMEILSWEENIIKMRMQGEK